LNPRWTEASYHDFYKSEYRKITTLPKLEISEFEQQWELVRGVQLRGSQVQEFCHSFIKPTDKVLEIGCSNGGILRSFQLAGYKNLFGVEPNVTESYFARESLGLNVFTGVLEDVHLSERDIDLILIVATIDHFLDPFGYLKNLRCLTRSGGYLYVDTADALEWIRCGLFIPKMDHAYYFTAEVMHSMLRRAGWEIVKFEAYNPFAYSINSRENWKRFDRVGIRFLARRCDSELLVPQIDVSTTLRQVMAAFRFQNSLLGRALGRLRGQQTAYFF
jgi:SAM-dependent methyltransferase